jgi:hypothetical protein
LNRIGTGEKKATKFSKKKTSEEIAYIDNDGTQCVTDNSLLLLTETGTFTWKKQRKIKIKIKIKIKKTKNNKISLTNFYFFSLLLRIEEYIWKKDS